jgi:hypothetical protein
LEEEAVIIASSGIPAVESHPRMLGAAGKTFFSAGNSFIIAPKLFDLVFPRASHHTQFHSSMSARKNFLP